MTRLTAMLAILAGLAFSFVLFWTVRSAGGAAWGALGAGLALTALLGLSLFSSSRQVAQVEGLLRERTAEVHALNDELARRGLQRMAELETAYREVTAELAEKQKAEAELRESAQLFRAVSDGTLDAILVLDGETGRILRANPAAREVLGYSETALVGQHFSLLFPESAEPPREQLLDELRVYGAVFHEQGFRRADGSVIPMDFTASIVPWGGAHAIIATLRDVRERRDAGEAQREREEKQHQAQKMEAVGRLAGGVAHDFNNLLMVVGGYADILLRRMGDGDPYRQPTEEIRKAAERAAALTAQLLSFGGGQLVQPRVVDLNRVAAEMEPELRRTMGDGIELSILLDSQAAWVRADVGEMEQVIRNLGANAREAMPTGGRLSLEIAEERLEAAEGVEPGRYVRLTVRDTGTGMAPEVRERVFEPFFSTKRQGKGAGLSLATAFGIVTRSGGQMSFKSEPGGGTTFRILLPRVEAPPPVAAPAPPGPPPSETVLLVEDEPAVRELALEILTAEGYTVLEAGGAEEALRLCQQPGAIHLLLTDVTMPGVGGRELALRLRGLRPDLKVMFMSGYTDDEALREGVKEGAAFLAKPFKPDALTRKVREVLRTS